MIEFAIDILVYLVCASEILYIIFRNPLINHFNLPILILGFITQIVFLGYTGQDMPSRLVAAVLIIVAAFLKWKFPHRSFEKPDWRYLITLFISALALIVIGFI